MALTVPALTDASLPRVEDAIAASGMAGWLNLSVERQEDRLTWRLGFDEDHIGNPVLRALHGGVISTFLECCASLELTARLKPTTSLRTTSVHTSFFRSSGAGDMLARIDIQRVGRRFAFLEASGWQGEPDNVVARAAVGIRVLRGED